MKLLHLLPFAAVLLLGADDAKDPAKEAKAKLQGA